MPDFKIYTSRYGNGEAIKASGYTAVGITLGRPRFKIEYNLVANLSTPFAPAGWYFKEPDEAKFKHHYLRGLDEAGTAIDAVLVGLYWLHGEKPLVLLCFEDLAKEPFCHRRLFAEWWTKNHPAGSPLGGPEEIKELENTLL